MSNVEGRALWDSEDCFPVKPTGEAYGYLEKGKFKGCTRERLIQRCSSLETPEIELVWHPGAERLVPIMTVDFLQGGLRAREKEVLRHNLNIGLFNVVVFTLFGLSFLTRTIQIQEGYVALVICFGLLFGVWPLWESWRDLRRFDATQWDASPMPYDRYAAWVSTRICRVTWLILACLGAVFVVQAIAPNSTFRAGLVKPFVTQAGQWWRLFTAPFLHGGLPHFIFNASALLGLGRLAEALAGGRRMALVFALAAFGGGVFSLLFMPHTTSVGASGGLTGLIGFLLILGWRRKAILPPGFTRMFVLNIILVAVMGAVAYSVVDNAAHLGGLLFGIGCGFVMVPRDAKLPLPPSPLAGVCGVVAIAVLVLSALFASCKILGKF
jgi:membrane associated rhomboid family serine protease